MLFAFLCIRFLYFLRDFAILKRIISYISALVEAAIKRKTSFEIDTAKIAAAKEVLGTKTLTDTVDAALSEVVKLQQRRKFLELLSTPGVLELGDPDVMRDAWR
jgi:Arc/MetJ family transcription regulator